MMYSAEFYSSLFDILRNFKEYKSYKGKAEIAVKAPAKKHSDSPIDSMTHMFNQASELYDESLKLIQQYQRLSPKNRMYLPGDIKRALLDNYHQFPEEFKEWVLGWIYHWYFER